MAPAVSVIIPAWDSYAGAPLLEAVASVERQDAPFELIVVDNASATALPDLPGARVVRLADRGTRGTARNRGLEAARAPLVVFLDADDVLLPGALAALLAGLASHPRASAYVMSILDGRTGARHRSPRHSAVRLARLPAIFAAANAVWSLLPVSGCAIMRANEVRACGGFGDADHGEDWELGVSLAFRGPIAFDERPALMYYAREDSPGEGATSPRVLLDNARRVRRRIVADPGVPAWGRTLGPALAAAQWLAVFGGRPVVRCARAVRAARGMRSARGMRPARAPGGVARPRAEGAPPVDHPPIRQVRIIARLNVGGPANQALTMTRALEDRGYRTRLVRGREGPDEGSMDYLADELGVIPTLVKSMRRDPGPRDLVAFARLVWILRRERPQIVHTHAAKAGTLGRMAALISYPRARGRPVLVHTYHGHSLTGYFSSRTASVYRGIERALGRRTDALVVVSAEVRDDLVRLGVAGAERFTVVPLGFDLDGFADDRDRSRRRAVVRTQWGLEDEDEVVTLIARLVPIKRVDRFLRAARLVAEARPRARFVVVGDGELREDLRASADARALSGRLVWAGLRRDMPDVYFASDVVVLTSDNEGTPVSLIEAQAAAVPVVSTDVGGVRAVVRDGETGYVATPEDEDEGLAAAIAALLDDRPKARALGRAGRDHVLGAFSIHRLVNDLDSLYLGELTQKRLSK